MQSNLSCRSLKRRPFHQKTARSAVHVRCAVSPGDKVHVKADLTVYHVPGFKGGLPIKGMQGEIVGNAADFKGTKLSPNYPWKVQFVVENKGKPRKFFVHLEEGELVIDSEG